MWHDIHIKTSFQEKLRGDSTGWSWWALAWIEQQNFWWYGWPHRSDWSHWCWIQRLLTQPHVPDQKNVPNQKGF
jgi:hypothetical protein